MIGDTPEIRQVRAGIWVYFVLLLFEGSLRKWAVPSLSGPLLLIRDPVAIWIYLCAFRAGLFPGNVAAMIGWLSMIAMLFSFLASFSADISSPFVTFYGLRTDFLHVPLIFIMPRALTQEDVRSFGKWTLLLAAPMAVLMVMQFRASADDFLNLGAGGGHQILSVRGKVRPAGTFSYVSGVVAYYSLVMSFFMEGLLRRGRYPPLLLLGGGVALLSSLSVSGSRSVVLALAIVVIGALVGVLLAPWLMERMFRVIAVTAIALFAAMSMKFFEQGLELLTERFVVAGGQEGITSRIALIVSEPFDAATAAPIFGYGLGLGTMAGAAFLTGRPEFLLAEGEWCRLLLESGPILGLILIVLRFGLAFWILSKCIRTARSDGNVLPMLIFAAVGMNIINGQWGQATVQGFTSFGAGLCLAACAPESPVAAVIATDSE